LEANQFLVNEAEITGEPDDKCKNADDDPFVLYGSYCMSGEASVMVLAVGSMTWAGV